MKIGLVGDTLVTLVMGGGTTVWAMRSPDSDVVLVAVATWLFLAAAWVFVLMANRGLWGPSGMDSAAFVDLSLRRCRSALMATWFASALFVCEVAFGLWWAYQHSIQGRMPVLNWLLFGSLRVDIVWVFTVIFFGAVAWYRRKKRSELSRLLQMRTEMTAPTTDVSEGQERLSSTGHGWTLGRGRRFRGKKNRYQR
jgi:hypothetical protein